MQVAANPFQQHLPHYHAYYHLPPPGPQDFHLKRQYLALLPPQQIIDICLKLDLHAPPYVRSTVWPQDINAAIAGLTPAQPPEAANPTEDVMNSLRSTTTTTEAQESTPATPPDREKTASPVPATPNASVAPESTTPAANPTESASPPATASETTEPPVCIDSTAEPAPASQPTPTPAPTPAPAPAQPPAHPQYPTAYAYPHPQATYPHAPYYASHPGGYSYPYASYPPMPTPYHPQPPPPASYAPPQAIYNTIMAAQQHPPQHEGVAADDLPSYEEMIVEALTECTDAEGWAPKDLFAWMASRYPLQSNFRPSASQALQKAFKRGRFEKSSNGKYRLNATWNGGNTSRRTTRRPQTQNSQATSSSSVPAPPFTNVPLVHHHHASAASARPTAASPAQPTYSTPFSYSYPPAGYPGYTAPQPHASTSTAPGTIAGAHAPTAAKTAPPGSDSDTAAAYEAAQNILSAINFNTLYQLAPEDQGDAAGAALRKHDASNEQSASGITGVEELLSHVQAMLASAEHSAAAANSTGSAMGVEPARAISPGDPRAELQAQLALLAAQLAEHAKLEDAEASLQLQMHQQQQPQAQQQQPTIPVVVLAPAPAAAPMSVLSPPPPLPPSQPVVTPASVPAAAAVPETEEGTALEPMPEEDEESDDDDMYEVI